MESNRAKVIVMDRLADLVRTRRQIAGLTQVELAARAGVSQGTVSDIERGSRKLPNADVRRRIAAALNLTHLAMLIAAGELTWEEAYPPDAGAPTALDRAMGEIRREVEATPDPVSFARSLPPIVRSIAQARAEYPNLRGEDPADANAGQESPLAL